MDRNLYHGYFKQQSLFLPLYFDFFFFFFHLTFFFPPQSSPEFLPTIESIARDLCLLLESSEIKQVSAALTAVANEKQRATQSGKASKKKGPVDGFRIFQLNKNKISMLQSTLSKRMLFFFVLVSMSVHFYRQKSRS